MYKEGNWQNNKHFRSSEKKHQAAVKAMTWRRPKAHLGQR
ncbi:hypothetical protein OOU_Y34scaffold00493g18 [Pyricularia oryzae Y34]|uniref:Uncharacterized protein n=2 Tax=Pyricularia oryzae TaxID=318829 RepID=A0AA97P061_PYRO3|nr:hypothetical protein OOU_Y34scaffold00493g18 [Pyricularia oryzae Y34]